MVRKWVDFVIQFFDAFLGDAATNVDEKFKGRILLAICSVAAVLLLPVTIYDSRHLFDPIAAALAWWDYLTPVLTLVLVRFQHSLKVANFFFLISVTISTNLAAALGDHIIYSNYVWLPLFPMLATFISGIKLGAIVAILAATLSASGVLFRAVGRPLTSEEISITINLWSVILGSLILSYTYDLIQRLWSKDRDHLLNEMHRLAHRDELTQLPNRRAFLNALTQVQEKVDRNKERAFLAQIDIDHFKSINDRFGHSGGDEALKIVAKILMDHVLEGEAAGRLGGEEFGLLLLGNDNVQVEARLEEIRENLANRLIAIDNHRGFKITMSVGYGQIISHEPTLDLINKVDEALYRAKSMGRNQVVHCDQSRSGGVAV